MIKASTEEVILLVSMVKDGDNDAFCNLEGHYKPLLISLSYKFSNYHHKFEFEDFYSIALLALYKACMGFNFDNPSFMKFANIVILRDFFKELQYWSQGKRSIFKNTEIESDSEILERLVYYQDDEMIDAIFLSDFREKLNIILDECFEKDISDIIRMHINGNDRICDIATKTNLDYKYVYQVVNRGTKKIEKLYSKRYLT